MSATNNKEFNLSNNEGTGIDSETNQISSESQSTSFEIDRAQFAHEFFLNQIMAIEEVTQIYQRFNPYEGIAEYWIMLERENRDVRRNIYSVEYDLLDRFGGLELLTHVVVRDDVGDINIADDAKEVYSNLEFNAA
ncbi:hypothetical protein ACFQMM_03485 [Saliphagus sp. GCM10025308]